MAPNGSSAFQSTLSVRRATFKRRRILSFMSISIHALRKESDGIGLGDLLTLVISIHALRKESDVMRLFPHESVVQHFNPRSP